MTEFETVFIAGSPRLACDVAGSGELVVLLHGIGGQRQNWHDQLLVFADDFQVTAWDARGYGDSEDYEGPLDFADFSADLARLLDHFGAARAHIVGLSMGGRIAQDFYEREPQRVASLVLCNTFAGIAEVLAPDQRAEFIRLRQEPLLAGGEPRDIAKGVAQSFAGPDVTEQQMARMVASMSALHKESYLKTIEATTNYDRTSELASFALPVLLVFGESDPLTPVTIGEGMQSRLPDSRLHVIPRAGHISNLEKPEEFNRVVLEFLRAQ
ncbi:MAG: alpha/beta fold hydrolase [Alphaproteobacteria bacterium]|jgi:3-oxoadipate enol-lactonase|nr:alpha/beta fold hydrolase [Alphaproteobacteria bacterium]HJP22145.1 alpha/beta fold hydrolase [Alphaproteobacteria bacterium]